MKYKYNILLLGFILSSLTLSCSAAKNDSSTTASTSTRYLYFASGGCYVGTLTGSKTTAATASGLVNRVLLDSAQIQGVPVFDYFQSGLNLWPVGITDYDSDYMLVNMMTSTAGFRVDKIKKSGLQSKLDYLTDITNLNTALRGIVLQSDGSILISRSTIIEKYNSQTIRVQNSTATASYINNPAGSCASSNTLVSSILTLPNGNILYTHAGGATNNRVGVVDKTGYAVVGDCKSAVTFSGASSPATIAVPTSAVLVPNTDPYQIIVATASSTIGNDQLYLFTVNSSTNVVTYVKSLYNDNTILRGISAMTYDSTTNTLYAANGSTSLGNTIEKLTYDSTTQTLTRTGTFLGMNSDSQCINSMFISN